MKDPTVLVVSNTDDRHADIVGESISNTGSRVIRLNTDLLLETPATWHLNGALSAVSGGWVHEGVNTVWYRKVRLPKEQAGVDRATREFARIETEGLLTSILAQYANCRWVSPLSSIQAASCKIDQLVQAKACGFDIPDSIITNSLSELEQFFDTHGAQVVVKPIKTQLVETDSRYHVVGTRSITRDSLADTLVGAPCFAQERLKIQHEIRVIVFGSDVYAFKLEALRPADDLKQLSLADIRHSVATPDAKTNQSVHNIVEHYGLKFAAIDLAVAEDGRLFFLEVNPNGQWLWLQYMTGFNLLDPFVRFLLKKW